MPRSGSPGGRGLARAMKPMRFQRRTLSGSILALLLIGFYYNAYRYPLQINSSGTSPTYADTPGWLSGGKYILISGVLAYLVLLRLSRGHPLRIASPLVGMGYLLLACMPIVSGILVGRADFIRIGLFFFLPLLLHFFAGWRFSYEGANRLLTATVWIAIGVELIQVLLFTLFGRLPALAHANSISVRFGSFLDDPNGFGLLLSWLAPFTFVHFRGGRRAVAFALLGVCLLLTQSLTALTVAVGVAAVLSVVYLRENPRALPSFAAAAGVALVAVGGAAFAYRRELQALYELYMLSKAGSLARHQEALTMFEDIDWLNLVGVQPLAERWEETGYFNLLAYFGLVYVGVYLLLGLHALLAYLRVYRDPAAPAGARHFAFGAMGLLMAVYVGNLGLPVVAVFPLDLFAALLLGLASAGLLRPDGPEAETPLELGDPPPVNRLALR